MPHIAEETWDFEATSIDLSADKRIPVLMDMVISLSKANDPKQLVDDFIRAMRKAYGKRFLMFLSTEGLGKDKYRILRIHTDEDKDLIADPGSFFDAARFEVKSGGFLADVILDTQPKLLTNLEVLNDPVIGDMLSHMRSMMAIPFYEQGEAIGWTMLFDKSADTFSQKSLEDAILRSAMLLTTVKYLSNSNALMEADKWIQQQVNLIGRLQKALLPQKVPRIAGLNIAISYETYDRAGGDYYNFVPFRRDANGKGDPHGPWAIYIADASGHGPAAAVMMAMFHAVVSCLEEKSSTPAEALTYIQKHLFARALEGQFVTAIVAYYDPPSRKLTYAAAGHPPALVKSPGVGGRLQRLDKANGLPIGVSEKIGSGMSELTLEIGETLVLYTDGITDTVSPQGVVFGTAGIERALTVCDGSPDCVVDSIMHYLRGFEGGERPVDDQTLIAMQVVAEQSAQDLGLGVIAPP